MRRISSASLPPIQEGDVLDGLEEEEVQEQEQNQEPEQEQKLAVVEPEEEEMDRSFQQEDPTMDSAAMDETRPIGGISIVVEEEYTFQRPLAQPADEEPAAEAEEAAVEDDESTQDMSIHRFRPSMAPTELPMDLTRPIGGIMRALESDLEEGELGKSEVVVHLALTVVLQKKSPRSRGPGCRSAAVCFPLNNPTPSRPALKKPRMWKNKLKNLSHSPWTT